MLSREVLRREIDCEHSKRWLSESLDQPLGDLRLAQLQAHLEHCPACQSYQKKLQGYKERISTLKFPTTFKVNPQSGASAVSTPSLPWLNRLWISLGGLVVFGALVVIILPNLKFAWDSGKIAGSNRFTQSRTIVERSIQAQLAQFASRLESDPAIPSVKSAEIIQTQLKATGVTQPQWLDLQFKGTVTRLLMRSSSQEKVLPELLQIIGGFSSVEFTEGRNAAWEQKPGGLLFDFFISTAHYPSLKQAFQGAEHVGQFVEMVYRPWDKNKTRIVLWVAISP